MINVHITHNPFIVDTKFIIDGIEPAPNSKLSKHKDARLQQWIGCFFDELSELFNGKDSFNITFRGVESDFLDVQEAAEHAQENGVKVTVDWEPVAPTEERLEKVRELIDEAREHPQFDKFIQNNDEVKHSIQEAFNRDFDVYVIATMSSGKSTLINAMLGHDLLPAANQATTATIARIVDNDSMGERFSAKRYDHSNNLIDEEENLTLEKLEEWNEADNTKLIDIEGNILAIEERPEVRLVLTDTPGPNNSQNDEHRRTTMGFIQDSKRNPLILYVLNAQQLGITDDSNLLDLVAEEIEKGGKQNRDRFIFVVNKMDVFDPEKGEDIASVLDGVKQYLERKGISEPLVYPVSAELTRLIRKANATWTRSERGRYTVMADLFSEEPSMDLSQYMPITARVKRNLEDKQLPPLELASGLPAVEAMIDEYIDKYNFPHRLKRANDALRMAVNVGLNRAEVDLKLDQDERELAKIRQEVERLQERQEKGFVTAAHKEKLKVNDWPIPKEIADELVELRGKGIKFARAFGDSFINEEATVTEAEQKLSYTAKQLRDHHLKVINECELLIETVQAQIREELKDDYKKHVENVFADVRELRLPVFDGILKSVEDIPFNVGLSEHEVEEKEERTGQIKVSDRTWYKPWTWFRARMVGVYSSKDVVNLYEVWHSRLPDIEIGFSSLLDDLYGEIRSVTSKLVSQYIAFMEREFEDNFSLLLNEVKQKVSDQEARERAIIEAKELQAWIKNFESKLNETLSV